jgi:hypothetical protein
MHKLTIHRLMAYRQICQVNRLHSAKMASGPARLAARRVAPCFPAML